MFALGGVNLRLFRPDKSEAENCESLREQSGSNGPSAPFRSTFCINCHRSDEISQNLKNLGEAIDGERGQSCYGVTNDIEYAARWRDTLLRSMALSAHIGT